MKFLKNKIILVLVVILLVNAVCPTPTYAIDIGGVLLSPVYWLLCSIYIPADLIFGYLVLEGFNIDMAWITGYAAVLLNPLTIGIDTIGGLLESAINTVADWFGSDGVEIPSITETLGAQKIIGCNHPSINHTISELFIGPDTMFKGDIAGLNANIFKYINSTGTEDMLGNVAKTVAKFYVLLRNIAAIILLGGLIFTGIRILISSNIPNKKAQWLTYLQDWLIGIILLIFSHIIMILIFELTEAIVTALSREAFRGSIKWTLVCNMMYSNDMITQTIALLLYHWVQWLTIVFAIAYFKRFFWTCILVVFAPVFCVMYAFGQQTKQIYSNWLKEFILNAMVQPFHLIVYTVLTYIPLTVTDPNGFAFSFEAPGKLVYALMAMAMIRPAERWLRGLFNMDKGIANMASYDSGKQTIVNTAKAVAAVAATVASGGAAAGAMAAMGGAGAAAGAAKGLSALGKAGNAAGKAGDLADKMGNMGEAANKLGEGMENKTADQKMLDAYDEKFGTSEWDAAEREQLAQGTYNSNESLYDNMSDTEMMQMLAENQGYNSIEDWKNDEYGDYADVAEQMGWLDQSDSGMKEAIAQGVEQGNEDTEKGQNALEQGIQNANQLGDGINVSDLNISAANVNMQGQLNDGNIEQIQETDATRALADKYDEGFGTSEWDSQESARLNEAAYGDEAYQQYLDSHPMTDDDFMQQMALTHGYDDVDSWKKAEPEEYKAFMSDKEDLEAEANIRGYEERNKAEIGDGSTSGNKTDVGLGGNQNFANGGNLSAGNITINAGTVNMEGSQIKTANTLQEGQANNNKDNNNNSESKEDKKLENSTANVNGGEFNLKSGTDIWDKIGRLNSSGVLDHKISVLNEAMKGANSIGSTLYVDGQAPSESQSFTGVADMVLKQRADKRKENNERAKDNWANNKANINIMMDNYLPEEREKMQKKYGKSKDADYIESAAQESAKTKAKAALKDMSAYVPYGITDVNTAYNLYKNANDKGLSPEQSIMNMAGFEKFNSNSKNLLSINQNIQYSGNNYKEVSQAIPNAREYYDNGYQNINEMQWLDYMAERLGKSPQYAMKLDEALKKKGGQFDYKGKDLDMKKVVEEINKHYKPKGSNNN